MKTYKVNVTWSLNKVVRIQASSKEEAEQKALEGDTSDGEYVDGSYAVIEEFTEED